MTLRTWHGVLPWLAVVLIGIVPAPVGAQWIEDATLEAHIQQGIRDTYSLRFDAADQHFRAVAQSRPDHPAGRFFLAMVDWWRILIEIENTSRDAAFVRKLDAVIALCDARLEKDETDVTALFFKGGAVGFRGRLHATRKEWIKAARDGREALPIVTSAGELAPDNADLGLGTGIYNYYAAVLPEQYRVLKPLMLFLPAGDKAKGLRQLRTAAEQARYARWEAMYFLVQAYSSYENRPSSALTWARKLREEFPANVVFHRAIGRIHVRLGAMRDAAAVFAEIRDLCRTGATGYGIAAEREAAYYIGLEALQRRDLEPAMQSFVRCDELSRTLDTDEPSGFMIAANLRIGYVHDLYGQRALALKQYDKVLAMRDAAGSHADAERHKREPYQR